MHPMTSSLEEAAPDAARLYALEPGGEEAFGALLDEAARWYRARGDRTFMLFLEDADPGFALRRGLVDLGLADLTVLSARLLPDFLDFVHEITAPQ